MKNILKLLVLSIFSYSEFAVSQYPYPPSKFEFIGLTSTKAYYISTRSNLLADFAEAKFYCSDYTYRLATIDTEALHLVNDYLKFTSGKNVTSDQIRTSAFLYPDYTRNAVWTTSGENIGSEIPLIFNGPLPGEAQIGIWLTCPVLMRSCEPEPPCETPECCTWATRLVHSVYVSKCLDRYRVLCEKKRDDTLIYS